MSKCRIVYKQDGTVEVIHPSDKSKHGIDGAIDRIYNQQFNGEDYDDVDTSELPNNRDKRYAWKGSKGKGIHIDNTVKKEKGKIDKFEDRIKALEGV